MPNASYNEIADLLQVLHQELFAKHYSYVRKWFSDVRALPAVQDAVKHFEYDARTFSDAKCITEVNAKGMLNIPYDIVDRQVRQRNAAPLSIYYRRPIP